MPNEKTICFCGHRHLSDKPGGVELQVHYIGLALKRFGWRTVFLCPSYNGAKGVETAAGSMEIWRYPHFSFAFQTPSRLILSMLDDIRPDVIYQRGRGQLTLSDCVLNYALQKGVRHVFAISSDRDLDIRYESTATLKGNKPLWKKGVLLPYAVYLDMAMRKVLKRTSYLVAQHHGQAEKVSKVLKRKAYLLRTIHPEVQKTFKKSVVKTVLWVTNYRPWKQGELFVTLAERCRVPNVRFIMVTGRAKPEYLKPFIGKARRLDNLTHFEELDPEEVTNLMERAHVFVNTSRGDLEGFPNTFVQSWLRETPTVTLNFDPGGVIQRENIGMCSRSFQQMEKDIELLLENTTLRGEYGRRAREYAERMHGFDHISEHVAQFFNETVSGRKKELGRLFAQS